MVDAVSTDPQASTFEKMLALKKPGERALIASRQDRCERSVILVGTKGDYRRGMVCEGEDYIARSHEYVRLFNSSQVTTV